MTDKKFSPLPEGTRLSREEMTKFTPGVVFRDNSNRTFLKLGFDDKYQQFDFPNKIPFGPVLGKNGVLAKSAELSSFEAVGWYRVPTRRDEDRIMEAKSKADPATELVEESENLGLYDHVDKPSHYFLIEPCEKYPNGVELNDLIWEKPINIGAAIKYLMRMGKKPGNSELQEIRKAHKHLELEIGHRKARGDAET